MLKGLEALEHINKNVIVAQDDIDEDINIIEKELKAYEELQKEYLVLSVKEKALEIIKKYVSFQEIDDDFFTYGVVDKQYVSNRSELLISKEEYDLVKEVLQ